MRDFVGIPYYARGALMPYQSFGLDKKFLGPSPRNFLGPRVQLCGGNMKIEIQSLPLGVKFANIVPLLRQERKISSHGKIPPVAVCTVC